MMVAQRAAALSILLLVNGLLAVVLLDGPGLLLAVAAVGCAAFAVGVVQGIGPAVAVGVALVAIPVVLAADRSSALTSLAVAAVAGLAASLALVIADASWWLRRDARVDAAVVRGLAATLAPIWLAGAGLGVAAAATTRTDGLSIWLLPAGITTAAALLAAGVWAVRRRHGRHDPLADIRN